MPKYAPSISKLGNVVLSAYSTLKPTTIEDAQVNASLVSHLQGWLNSSEREASESAIYAVNRFVAAELDFTTAGSRGMGRLNEDWPRFGGKYRQVLTDNSEQSIEELRHAFGNQLFCGYLFCEYLVQCVTNRSVPRVDYVDAKEELVESWVPTIYSQFGPRAFDARMAAENPKGYYDVKGLWGHATGDFVHDCFRRIGVPLDEFAQLMIRQYFDAGMMLRLAETEKAVDKARSELKSAESKGSANPTKNTGCVVMVIAGISVTTLICAAMMIFC